MNASDESGGGEAKLGLVLLLLLALLATLFPQYIIYPLWEFALEVYMIFGLF